MKSKSPKANVKLQNMCKSFGLVDIWRTLSPDGREYTFCSKLYCRIDFFFASKSLVYGSTCSIGTIIISDHAWVSMEMSPRQASQHCYRWRFNSSLLQRV